MLKFSRRPVSNSQLHDTNLNVHCAQKVVAREKQTVEKCPFVTTDGTWGCDAPNNGPRESEALNQSRQVLKFALKFASCHTHHCFDGTPDSLGQKNHHHCDRMFTVEAR